MVMLWETDLFPLSELLEENPNPVMRVDMEGKVLYTNKAGQLLLQAWNCGPEPSLPSDLICQLRDQEGKAGERAIEVWCGNRIYSFRIFSPPDKTYFSLFGQDVTAYKNPSGISGEQQETEQKLRASRQRLRIRNAALVALAKSEAIARGNLKTAMREITETSACVLGCERVSVWLYDAQRSKIRCLNLYELSRDRHTHGAELLATDYPSYFQALESERAIAADDACRDEQTRQLTATYLRPLGITSMLDAPLRFQGRVIGVICHEQVGEVLELEKEGVPESTDTE